MRIFGARHVRWPLVHAADLANLYARALEGASHGETFNGVSIPALPVGEIARAAGRLDGAPAEPEFVDLEVAVAEFGDWAAGYGLDQAMLADRARARLGWSPTRIDWKACLKNAAVSGR